MDFANHFILIAGALGLLSILASRLSDRLGAPLLLIFLVLGMLAGEDGIGGIAFNDILSANLMASLALAVILFDGGLQTRYAAFRTGLRPASVLATLGVVLTVAVTGVGAVYFFDLSWLEGMLIGAIVGSTDAAAVFALLHGQGLHLNERVRTTLEIESGANDPMAAFLTLTFIELVLQRHAAPGAFLILDFLFQMGVGALIGGLGGIMLRWLIDRLTLPDVLYPLLALAGGILIYGGAASLGGSGFLAAYLGGLVAGNGVHRSVNSIRRFHAGMAWLSQIGLFLMLGLLVSPSELLNFAAGGLLIALVLVFIARPLAVLACLWPFRFTWNERLFICWVGLRGAVPIVLGIYPLLAGVEVGQAGFNVAFCVVLVSLVLQGWTIAPAARWLKVQVPMGTAGRRLAEFDAPGELGREVVVYEVATGSHASHVAPTRLPLPKDTQVMALMRNSSSMSLTSVGQCQPGDHVYLMTTPESVESLETLFGATELAIDQEQYRFFGEFVLDGDAALGALATLYNLSLPDRIPEDQTVSDLFWARYRNRVVVGDTLRLGDLEFVARQLEEGRVTKAGLKLPHEA